MKRPYIFLFDGRGGRSVCLAAQRVFRSLCRRFQALQQGWEDSWSDLDRLVGAYKRSRDVVYQPLLRVKNVRIVELVAEKLRLIEISEA